MSNSFGIPCAPQSNVTLISTRVHFSSHDASHKSGTPTSAESRIISLVAAGMTNREIAAQIGTTEHVVKNRLRRLYDKLGFRNRVELALWYEARQFELTQSPPQTTEADQEQ